jgi:hypothetical protein
MVVHLAYGAGYIWEKKWADEITPGIVVGDPAYLEGRAGHQFLTIYTEVANATKCCSGLRGGSSTPCLVWDICLRCGGGWK